MVWPQTPVQVKDMEDSLLVGFGFLVHLLQNFVMSSLGLSLSAIDACAGGLSVARASAAGQKTVLDMSV